MSETIKKQREKQWAYTLNGLKREYNEYLRDGGSLEFIVWLRIHHKIALFP